MGEAAAPMAGWWGRLTSGDEVVEGRHVCPGSGSRRARHGAWGVAGTWGALDAEIGEHWRKGEGRRRGEDDRRRRRELDATLWRRESRDNVGEGGGGADGRARSVVKGVDDGEGQDTGQRRRG